MPTKVEGFWNMVNTDAECWLWTGKLDRKGYGRFGTHRAHRYSYETMIGDIPRGMFVCHRCDTPGCVRPTHLFLGTARDNMQDCLRKGRHPKTQVARCKQGHPFSATNTLRTKRGWRRCRICNAEWTRDIQKRCAAAEGREYKCRPLRRRVTA